MVDEAHPHLSLVRQCQLLGINRSSLYYRPVAPSEEELTLLRLLDQQYLKTPFYGSRRMMEHLRQQGYQVNRKRVRRLMHQLGLQAIYPKPKLSKAHPEHKIYPYLLREVEIVCVNQVWSTDITYLPVLKGISIWWRLWTGIAVRCSVGECRIRWMFISVLRLWRRRSESIPIPRSSTLTKAPSSQLTPSQNGLNTQR